MRRIHVAVQADHIERLCTAKNPVSAVSELIWNSLDANATTVTVVLKRNELEGIAQIRIRDNGDGMRFDEVEHLFGNLGGSWKGGTERSKKEGRLLHGRFGKGRYRAFSLGAEVKWTTRFFENGDVTEYTITASYQDLTTFEVSDQTPSEMESTGTEVLIDGISKPLTKLLTDESFHELTTIFATYLGQYPMVRIEYDGRLLTPDLLRASLQEYEPEKLELSTGATVEVSLAISEWRTELERAIYLCDTDGFAIEKAPAGIHAPGYSFTAYLKSSVVRELFEESGSLVLTELDPAIHDLLEYAREKLRARYREISAGAAGELVQQWKEEETYPYSGEPVGPVEVVERQVFDVLAVSINDFLPDFEKGSPTTRRFQFRLLRQALEESPKALQRILEEVIQLPNEKLEQLAGLLEETTLTAIINAAATVAERLDFITALESLLFDYKKHLKERSQLLKILQPNTWLFGEEFALMVSDQTLTKVLQKHIHLLGREKLCPKPEPVLKGDGSAGIVDLMLSRSMRSGTDNRHEHLIVELKRPSQKINKEVLSQVEEYAFAVAEDERFSDTNTHWVFWTVSNELNTHARHRARLRDKPPGLVHEADDMSLTIWAKTWGEILQDCRNRMVFFQERLQYAPDDESALARLREIYKGLGLPGP